MKPTRTWRFLQAICRIVTSLAFDLKVYGVHRLPQEGGVLVVSNHQSYLDPVLLAVRTRRPLSYMAKSELFRHKAFTWLIRALGAFPVRQGAGDVRAIKEAIERVQEGHALVIFPEGSRSHDGKLLPVEPGVALVIRKAKVPVVPCVIDGAYRAWPKGAKFPRPAPVRIIYGHPIDLTGMDRDQVVTVIQDRFARMLQSLREGTVPPDHRER